MRNRVLHCVGGKYFGVVTLRVRGLEVTFKADGDGQLLDIVATFLLRDAQQANSRFAIIVRAQTDRHASTPAVSAIAEWTQQNRNVKILARIADAEDDAHLRIQGFNLAVSEVGVSIERETIRALD